MAPTIAGVKLFQAFLRKKRSWQITRTGPLKGWSADRRYRSRCRRGAQAVQAGTFWWVKGAARRVPESARAFYDRLAAHRMPPRRCWAKEGSA
jgi:hypothetical protein